MSQLLGEPDRTCQICGGQCDGIGRSKQHYSTRRALVQSAHEAASESNDKDVIEEVPLPPGKRAKRIANDRAKTLRNTTAKHPDEDRSNGTSQR